MTQQYLCGELASLLARLEDVAARQGTSCAVHALRRDAECSPPDELSAVAQRALQLADALCWDALEKGDIPRFADDAAIAADLHEFATCARLLEDDNP
ncbi:MAG: hypothetical protein LBV34_03385 [Nocardiopsaceae bacterium]|jgi:hypothetical protein|nr:hypothetical protein [Nocardiopsaceae bacterium]